MATQQVLLSPAELAYLHSSLSLQPPIRPDGRSPTQFRPLTAETGILPGTNGSARVCFSDGTEAIVGIKAEIEKSTSLEGAEGTPTISAHRGHGCPVFSDSDSLSRDLNSSGTLTSTILGYIVPCRTLKILLSRSQVTTRLWSFCLHVIQHFQHKPD